MATEGFDAIVVGGGSGGLAAAKRAAKLGARVALIEKAELGGTCVNRGCVPKKLMWDAARSVLRTRRMAEQGLCSPIDLDLGRLRDLSAQKIAGLNDTFESQLSEAGVTLIRGTADIEDHTQIRAAGRTLSADRLILATGAVPDRPDFPGADLAEVSDDVFGWREVPSRLVILGGGYIGCEFAAIFAALGAQVTLVEPTDRVLDTFAKVLAAHARTALDAQGVTVLTGTAPERIERDGDGLAVVLDDGTRLAASRVLAATGRMPPIDKLGAISMRLERAESGALAVDENFATGLPGVHAIGDAADRLPLTPVATRDGETLADQLFGDWRAPIDLGLVATTAFLFPPHSQVGDAEGGKAKRSDPLRAGVTMAEGKAGDLDFFALAHERDRLTGAALAFDGAEEAIATLGALIAAGGGKDDLTAATGVHPTPAEEMLGR